MNHPEEILQAACVQWFRYQPRYKKYARLLMHIPNGGYRTKAQAARFVGQGVIPGVPDLLLAVPHGIYHGLWIEMKAWHGKVSMHQYEMQELLKAQGYSVAVCRSFDEFMEIVTDYLNPNPSFTNPLFVVGKIIVLQGRIAHVKGNKDDLIIRLTDDFMMGIDKINEAIKLGYGSIREATLEEKEYWFLCHDNSDQDFGVCRMSNYREWITYRQQS